MAWNALRWLRSGMLTAFVGLLIAGCGKSPATPSQAESKEEAKQTTTPVSTQNPDARTGSGKSTETFLEATLPDPPENGAYELPERTVTGKSIGKLYLAVAGEDGKGGLWDKIRFTSAGGKKLQYHATIRTAHGIVKIELWPDVAPNHVRNFIALAQAGYYDGLAFDRTAREEFTEDKGKFLEYLEAGCPMGTGEWQFGSIGYWMKPEISDKVKHEEGTIGAWHGIELESAACKFYINLSKAPSMDATPDGGGWTIFGKVVQGMDVLRTILSRPTREDEPGRPREPVVMQSVTIQSVEAN